MRLINITNSYSQLVSNQLANTDAKNVYVYSLGKTTVLHSLANHYQELLISNHHRNVQQSEIDFVLDKLIDKSIAPTETLNDGKLVQMTLPIAVSENPA